MLFASYSDVMPSATERASLFFLTTSMQYLAQTFCPSIGALLMDLDGKSGTPQVNMCVSLVLAASTAFIAIFLFPETVHESRKGKTTTSSDSHTSVNDQETMKPKKPSWLSNLSTSVCNIGLLNLSLLGLSIWFAAIAIKMVDWFALVQYPVIKLHWSFPQASNIVSIEGILLLIYFSLILPVLNRAAALWLGSSGAAHFSIMAVSSILLAVGAVSIGLASSSRIFVLSVVLYLFGEGMPTATQAYIVSVIDKASVARVMASLSVASIGGKLVASILFPMLLAAGLNLHQNVWIGLPFFVCAGLFVVSAGCVAIVGMILRVTHRSKTYTEEEREA